MIPDPPYVLTPGRIPLLVSFPHVGTALPPGLAERLSPQAGTLPDTDWLLPDLYDFLHAMGASRIVARYSRYVVDLNRPATDESLYPGQTTTGLFPAETFDGGPVWRIPLTAAEKTAHRERIWAPYHAALAAELQRIRAAHGYALLWDAHSIAPVLPRLFPGRLPDLNLGSNDGRACPPAVAAAVLDAARSAAGMTAVLDGRFKGGHITRSYGQPAQGVHALQLELSQATHLAPRPAAAPAAVPPDPPLTPALDPAATAGLRPVLRRLLETFLAAAAAHHPAAPLTGPRQ
ncbi:N-formylglutamate deformylase [Oleisolibacter albus]|uniref:N-formylglutamate deformylase n=1 Tax=Oleisolibacter albus TaxID=2171757 RepID=UPI000DF23976|nr:N-formylglutamate deformylase [Oleisolibacter albus]